MSPLIMNRDILIVDRSIKPIDKSIIAIFFNGNPICKQLVLGQTEKKLHSLNPKYLDILVTEEDSLELFGVVIGLARDFK